MAGEHVLITGPIAGTLVVNGQAVDVTPDVLAFDTLEQAQAVADAIGQAHASAATDTKMEV